MDNLATLLQHDKRHEEAEVLRRQALELTQEWLGTTHADTLRLASLFKIVLRRRNAEVRESSAGAYK